MPVRSSALWGLVLALMLPLCAPAAMAQVAEAQRLLNAIGFDAGPADGAAGAKTRAAWSAFLAHRGLAPDTPLDADGVAELRGQTGVKMPRTQGLDLRINAKRFPSRDSYSLDPDDPGMFTVVLKKGDYDPVDYRSSGDYLEQSRRLSLEKQRAELVSQDLRLGQTYTLDFEVRATNAGSGTFFQIHRGDSRGAIPVIAWEDSIRISGGQDFQNVAIHRGAWLGQWTRVRIVFQLDSGRDTWLRAYVNGTQTLDTTGRNVDFPFSRASRPSLHFGMYRGASPVTSITSFRNLALARGDLGPPPPPPVSVP